jgi:hypothetical protein
MHTAVKKVIWYPAITRREFEETKQLLALENWKNDDVFTLFAKEVQESHFAITFVRCSDTFCSVKSFPNLPIAPRSAKWFFTNDTLLLYKMQGTVSINL